MINELGDKYAMMDTEICKILENCMYDFVVSYKYKLGRFENGLVKQTL